MEELLERCAGMDVHRDNVVVTIMIGFGKKIIKETKTFNAMTHGLRSLVAWLIKNDIKIAAMESTGVYWKPVFNILEEEGVDIILANARHVKNVPGRKTDVKDSEWLAKLLKCGLIARSFIPPERIRHLRDLTRYRLALVQSSSSAKNRLIKTLESANIKLSSVFTDVYGKAAWYIIQGIIEGETDLEKLMVKVNRNVKASREEIKQALNGTIKDHHRAMLRIMVAQITDLERLVKSVESEIQTNMLNFSDETKLIETAPGVSSTIAANIIAEVGVNMNQFATKQHLASWAGLCPGNNESAGKKKALI